MEASAAAPGGGADPFAPAESTDDPFATPSEAVEAEIGAEPVAAEVPAEDIPVVDKEGEPVQPAGEFNPVSQAVEGGAAEQPAQAAQEPQSAPETTPAPSEAVEAPEEAPQAAEEPKTEEAPPAPTPETDAANAAKVEQQPTPPATDPPAESDAKPKEVRHYKVLLLTAERTWEEIDLATKTELEGVKVVKTDDDELWYEARNNEHANKLAYAIVGSPPEVRLWAVPKGSFKPKTIKPKPPKPDRVALDIS